MNIVFTDTDGVLTNAKSFDRIRSSKNVSQTQKALFNRDCVNNFNKFTRYTDSKIVIISSWRMVRSMAAIKERFKKNGIEASIFGKICDEGKDKSRGECIREFLKNNSVEYFYIIDNDDEGYEEYDDHFIQTSSELGFHKSYYEIAVRRHQMFLKKEMLDESINRIRKLT